MTATACVPLITVKAKFGSRSTGTRLWHAGRRACPEPILERLLGQKSFGVMGIEALNNAARAAGFAMAAPDDTPEQEVVRKPVLETGWRPAAPVGLLAAPATVSIARPSQVTDWFKTMLGTTGRGAPAGAR